MTNRRPPIPRCYTKSLPNINGCVHKESQALQVRGRRGMMIRSQTTEYSKNNLFGASFILERKRVGNSHDDDHQEPLFHKSSCDGGSSQSGSALKFVDFLFYLQFAINVLFVFAVVYVCGHIVAIYQKDWALFLKAKTELARSEGRLCWQNYQRNQCDFTGSLPAMERACSKWAHCMDRDPTAHLTSQESLLLLADTLNRFSDAITLKTFLGVLVSATWFIITSNFGIGAVRRHCGSGLC